MNELHDVVIPSSPTDRKKIKDAFEEISASKSRIAGEREYIKEAIAMLSEEFDLPKRFLRKMANAYHDDSFDKISDEADLLESAKILIIDGGEE